jgi:hypothetical protein
LTELCTRMTSREAEVGLAAAGTTAPAPGRLTLRPGAGAGDELAAGDSSAAQYSLRMSSMMSVALTAYSCGIVSGGMKRNTLP